MWLHACSLAAAPDGFAATAAASSGGDVETGFWLKWLRSEGRRPSQYPNHADFLERTAENAALPEYLCDLMRACAPPSQRPLRVLDSGAGPLSSLGTHCGGVRVELFPIDVLAPSYDGVLDQVKLTPRTRTRFCPVEQIDRCFAPAWFDLATSFNALDHAQDPIRGLMQLTNAVRPGCAVALVQKANESNRQRGIGIHQWNLFPRDGRLCIARTAEQRHLRGAGLADPRRAGVAARRNRLADDIGRSAEPPQPRDAILPRDRHARRLGAPTALHYKKGR